MSKSREVKQRTVLYFSAIALLFGLILALQMTGVVNSYVSGILVTAGINIILAVSLNLTTGLLGQLVLGHAGFMSVGAYTSAILTKAMGLPITAGLPIGLLAGGLMAALIGFLIGIPALRLRGDYLAIITLGFGEIIRVVIQNLAITGNGVLFGAPTLSALAKYAYTFVLTVITIMGIYLLMKSRHGRAILSIREDEIAAEASGIPTTYYKTMAFVIAAFFAGVAGGLYATHLGVVDASKFDFNRSVEIVIFVVLGGMGSITGSVLAALLLTILPEALRAFSDYRMLVYSLVLVLVMIFKPTGLFGRYEISLYNFLRRRGLFKMKDVDKSAPHDAAGREE